MTQTPHETSTETGDAGGWWHSLDRLRRSTTDRKVSGLAGGLGRHFDLDPTILRVAFVVLVFFGGAGLLLYAAGWLLVPEDGSDRAQVSTEPRARRTLLLATAVVAGLLLLGDAWRGPWLPLPLAVIALIVLAIYLSRRDKDGRVTDESRTHGPTSTGTPATGAWATSPSQQPSGGATGATPPPSPSPRPRVDRGPVLFWPTLAVVALALGVLGLVEVSGVAVPSGAYPALALAVTGAALVVGAWFGRAGGLVILGILALLTLSAVSVTPDFEGPHEIDARPATASQLQDEYHLGAGRIALDLTELDASQLDGRNLRLEANVGEIVVTVPDGLDVDVNADVGLAGDIRVEDELRDGLGPELETNLDGGADVPTMDLDLELLAAGSIEVRQQ